MELSLFLAKVIGIVIAAFGLAGLARPKLIRDAVHDFHHESFARLVIGCIAIAAGAMLVLTHNVWEWSYQGIITVFGWLALAKGIGYLVMPKALISFTKGMLKTQSQMQAFLVACLILGGYLAYKGFGF